MVKGGGGIIWSPVLAKRSSNSKVGWIYLCDGSTICFSLNCSANSSQEESQTKQYVWATIDISYLIIKKYMFLLFTMKSIVHAYINWLIVISW